MGSGTPKLTELLFNLWLGRAPVIARVRVELVESDEVSAARVAKLCPNVGIRGIRECRCEGIEARSTSGDQRKTPSMQWCIEQKQAPGTINPGEQDNLIAGCERQEVGARGPKYYRLNVLVPGNLEQVFGDAFICLQEEDNLRGLIVEVWIYVRK